MKPILLALSVAAAAAGCAHPRAAIPLDPSPSGERAICRFSCDTDLRRWKIQNGGGALGTLSINGFGNAVFAGTASGEPGDFSLMQRNFAPAGVSGCRTFVLGLKGDGKTYQLRVGSGDTPSYACDFQTSGNWETVEIPFADLVALPGGDPLEQSRYPGQTLAGLQLIAGRGTPGSFRIEIDKIWLK